MRKFVLLLAIAALLALPGLAMAAGPAIVPNTATVDLLTGTHVVGDSAPVSLTGEASSISSPFGVGGTFDLWMIVTSDGDLDGLQWDFEINSTDKSTDLTVNGKSFPNFFAPTTSGADGFGSVYDTGFVPVRWAPGDYTGSASVFDSTTGEVLFRNSGFTPKADLQSGSVQGYDLSWSAALPIGTYNVGLSARSKWTSQDATGASLEGQLTGDDFVLTITPEPATALLLLGALPFMRRRR